MRHTERHFYEFGPFRLDPQRRRLLRDGEAVPLNAKAVDALLALVQHPGRMLERETLMRAVWADALVEDANLTVAISHVRKALGENGTTEYIETIPRVGYRFVAEVRDVREEAPALVIEKHTVSETVIEEEVLDAPKALTEKVIGSARSTNLALIGTLVLLAAALGTVLYLRRSGNTAPLPVRSLAVLAPKALSAEAEISSLSMGIADALITRLGGLNQVAVRPTSAISRYAESRQDPLEVGRALKVDAVLEGSLQRADGRVRIRVRLMDVRSGTQLWAGTFDEADADIFKLQDVMSAEVAEALALNLTPHNRVALTKRETTNPQAYASYMEGIYFWNKRGPEVARSIPHFQKAIALDPNFARAYVALANVHAVLGASSPEAETLIEKALQLDNTLAEAHATRGFIRMFHHWDWEGAEQDFDRAIQLDPHSSHAHHWRGVYLSLRRRLDEAKAEMHRALELDPQSAIITADIGQLHYFARQYDQAIDYCRRALALDSDFPMAHIYLGFIYGAKGMEQEAFAEWLLNPDQARLMAEIDSKAVFARSGSIGVAQSQLEYYLGPGRAEAEALPMVMVGSYLAVGDKENAMRWLVRSYEEHNFMLPFINVDPSYDSLRDDPRFQDILRRIGLQS
jgi:DNA-binding winged helix-turn-helix (wHTH) protein/TolB-like protein/Flp pilus assembly protein TadD